MIVIQHYDCLLLDLFADFGNKDIRELIGLRRKILGLSHKAQHRLAEFRVEAP